jgi:hypothetical protein
MASTRLGGRVADENKNIPLECLLCVKNPKFSDISHLLTHISSKSHLAQQFSVGLRAKNEPPIKERLRRYEKWYEENGIEDLLQERMAAKVHKKTGRRIPRNMVTVRQSDQDL